MALRGATFFLTGPYLLPDTRGRDRAMAAFHAARQEDVERGGDYDAHGTAINFWTSTWPSTWTDPCTGESTLMETWYFQWGKVLDYGASISTTAICWRTSSRS